MYDEISDINLPNTNGWGTWKKHVLHELGRMDKSIERNSDEITMLKIEQAKLIIRVGLIVGIISAVTSAMASAFAARMLGG